MTTSVPGIVLFERDQALYLRHEPVAGRVAVPALQLASLVAEFDGIQWRVSEALLAAAAARCNTEARVFELVLAQRRAAEIHVAVSPDQTQAMIELLPGDNVAPICLADALKALAEAGVLHGIDELALAAAIATGTPQSLVAATCQAALPGCDSRFEVLIEDHRDRAPTLDALGMIDFREQGAIPMVEIGQPLMRRSPATPGTAGCDVGGKPIPAVAGRDDGFDAPFTGAALDPVDRELLRATSKGQPVRVGNAVLVESVFQVKEVNLASGNIHFDGTVQIDGDIAAGMQVQASGDIVVNGTVEGGVLDASGDIRIQGGAIARAKLTAGGSVAVRFVETATVRAGLAIVIDDSAVHSDLQAGAQITVGEKSRQRGRLAGGSACARMRISAPFLGAATGGRTRIQVGVYPELDARLLELAPLAEQQKAEAEKLEQLVQVLGKADPKGMLERVRQAWQQSLRRWGELLEEKKDVERRLAAVLEARVQATVGVAGEIELVIGRKQCRIERTMATGAFSMLEDGSIIYTDALQAAHKIA